MRDAESWRPACITGTQVVRQHRWNSAQEREGVCDSLELCLQTQNLTGEAFGVDRATPLRPAVCG